MTIRILADREPYASYAASIHGCRDGKGPAGPFFVLCGPEPLDAPPADLLAMPARDFVALPGIGGIGSLVIAYGPAAMMDEAFERGCADYLREPWPLLELLARAGRLLNPRAELGDLKLSLVRNRLTAPGSPSVALTDTERRLARLLIMNSGLPVTREALRYAAWGGKPVCERAIDNHISSLREKMEQVQKGAGKALVAIRGVGYRLTSTSCG